MPTRFRKFRTVLWRNFLSILCVILVLLVLFQFILSYVQYSNWKQLSRTYNEQTLNQITNTMDSIISSADDTVWNMMFSSTILRAVTDPIKRSDEERTDELLTLICDIANSNHYINSIMIYVKDNHCVYSSNMWVKSLDDTTCANLFSAESVNPIGNQGFDLLTQDGNIYTRVSYLPGYSGGATILVELNKDLIAQTLNLLDNHIAIITADGKILFQLPASFNLELLDQMYPELYEESSIRETDDAVILYAHSAKTSLDYYYCYTPITFSIFGIYSSAWLLLTLVLLLLVAGYAAFAAAKVIYRPMRDVVNKLDDPVPVNENEWTVIGKHISRNTEYRRVLEAVPEPILNHLLADLLNEETIPEDVLPYILSATGSSYTRTGNFYLFVTSDLSTGILDQNKLPEICSELNRQQYPEMTAYSFPYRFNLLTLIQDRHETAELTKTFLRHYRNLIEINTQGMTGRNVAISQLFHDLRELSSAFRNTYSGMVNSSIVDYTEYQRGISASVSEYVSKMYDMNKDAETAAFHHLLLQIDSMPQDLKASCYQELQRALWASAASYSLIESDPLEKETDQTESVELLRENVVALHDRIITSLHDKLRSRSYRYVHNARKYILENYADPNLSMSTIAEYVGINDSYLGRLFKETYGKSVNQFLNETRINNARQALENKNVLIKDIYTEVGFTTVQNFMRVFKQVTGMTPSEYRALNGTEQKS